MGRTRLLEEIGVRAQIAGAGVVRVDASIQPRRAAARRARWPPACWIAVPGVARDVRAALPRDARLARAARSRPGCPRPRHRSGVLRPAPATPPPPRPDPTARAEQAAPDARRLVRGDQPRQAARRRRSTTSTTPTTRASVCSWRSRSSPSRTRSCSSSPSATGATREHAAGLVTLRGQCARLELGGLSPAETLELVRSLFGDAPNVERFAEWLHGRTAGGPLHCVEISRQLVAREVIRYIDGMWALPGRRPGGGDPRARSRMRCSIRLGLLTAPARALAECLSLQREQPTLDLCRAPRRRRPTTAQRPRRCSTSSRATTSSTSTRRRLPVQQHGPPRGAPRRTWTTARREHNHRRLGEAFAWLAGPPRRRAPASRPGGT